ncbi:MAG: helix-turn-helix domain containing protein, partial [Methanomicrobiales archaeon]|nr:helix-turn-helix domain containing protein [Methanomicrobiales archaeon]
MELTPEEQERIQAIQRFLKGDYPVDIYQNFNRSKKWFNKWLNRYHTGKTDWYKDLSKRPHVISKK